ncbi:glycosyltransferase family 2 protein [Poseidonocella sedimentorum]|uniref:Glycosyl transferase family 2 n=1 Tax=Poseidonocella sedimentorum TaxID=871652 RepID=A0A1I6EB08_9RHOB|nr:glycosyltransferase family 2 protein [Poseidonocella sedimentorum]SFR14761.1 Glycosyl transferase family 2 [Poseidonocella sedimentorum]
MKFSAAAVTMVRDDAFFLEAWVRYYEAAFGREALYVVNHGRQDAVRKIAAGCNVIDIPDGPRHEFDTRRWRFLNNMVNGLRSYFTHVIVGDVDEFVVADPERGSLAEVLGRTRGNRILTPMGLEVVHLRSREPEPLGKTILGPRRHVRHAPHYSKPCIVSTPAKLARGGHYADCDKLQIPDGLYLLHMKYCDYELYCDTMDRRNAAVSAARQSAEADKRIMIGRHWFPDQRKDAAIFEGFDALPLRTGFDLSGRKARMLETWGPRGQTGFWEFDPSVPDELLTLPDRFFGIL